MLDALLARRAWQSELLAAIEKGKIPAGQIDAARRQRLTNSPDAAVRKQAEKLFAGGTSPDRVKVIDDYKAALTLKSDATRGKAVFAQIVLRVPRTRQSRPRGRPGSRGALANKSPLYLLSEILDPNRNLDPRYVEYLAVTKDERTVNGVLAAETATSITLRGQQAKRRNHSPERPPVAPGYREVAHAGGAGKGHPEAGHGRSHCVPHRARVATQEVAGQRTRRSRRE